MIKDQIKNPQSKVCGHYQIETLSQYTGTFLKQKTITTGRTRYLRLIQLLN